MAFLISRRAAFAGGLLFPLATLPLAVSAHAQTEAFADAPERQLSDRQWRARLSAGAHRVLRRQGTELPFTSTLNRERRAGTYACAGCGLALFRSEWKYNSGTGWPSFSRVMNQHVGTRLDRSFGMARTEYHCARCLGHQGHLFDDGPPPTGHRYCNNGIALTFLAD